MLAVAYALVAPDRATLAATRGAVGAASAARNGHPVIRAARSRARNAAQRRAQGRDAWSYTKRAGRGVRSAAIATARGTRRAARAARTGAGYLEPGLVAGARGAGRAWHRFRRARAGRGRTTTGTPVQLTTGTGTAETTGTPPAAEENTDTRRSTTSTPTSTDNGTNTDRPDFDRSDTTKTEKGNPQMTETTITENELDGLDAVAAEIGPAGPMLERLEEALTAVRDWASRLPDRWAGTEWGTKALDQALSGAPEAAQGLGSTEQLMELVAAAQAAIDEARGISEVVNEQGAYGKTEAFAAR